MVTNGWMGWSRDPHLVDWTPLGPQSGLHNGVGGTMSKWYNVLGGTMSGWHSVWVAQCLGWHNVLGGTMHYGLTGGPVPSQKYSVF